MSNVLIGGCHKASSVNNSRTVSGRIVVKSKTGQLKASVGYHVTVPGSYLHYNVSSTKFLASDHQQLPSCRQLSVVNDFALPVDIIDASIAPQVPLTFNPPSIHL